MDYILKQVAYSNRILKDTETHEVIELLHWKKIISTEWRNIHDV